MASRVTSEAGQARKLAHSSWNPFRVSGTELPPHILLMAKILAICFLLTLNWRALPDHFLPFLPIFDHAGPPLTFKRTLEIVFFTGAFCLLFNYRVRTACLVLGGIMFVALLSSRTFYENNRTYTACLWFLAGLQPSGMKAWPLRVQVMLLYFGAGLNKLLDADWRSGQFFENMVVNLGHVQAYIRLSSWLPHLWLSCAMGWIVIIVEFVIAIGFVIRRLVGLITWIGIAYHTTLLVVAGTPFGMFYFATLSSFLVFMNWPLPSLELSFADDGSKRLGWLPKFDLDGLFVFVGRADHNPERGLTGKNALAGLRLNVGNKQYASIAAVYMWLVYNPLTYFFFAIILSLPVRNYSPFRLAWSVVFLFFITPALLGPALRVFRSETGSFRSTKFYRFESH